MAEVTHLTKSSDWIDLGFVESERTARLLMESASVSTSPDYYFQIKFLNSITSVSIRVQSRPRLGEEADLQRVTDWRMPNRVVFDETVIRIDGNRFWL